MRLLNTSPDPLELFLNSVGSKQTKRQYASRLEDFLYEVEMREINVPDMAREFVKKALKDNQWAFGCAVSYVSKHRARYDRKEITA